MFLGYSLKREMMFYDLLTESETVDELNRNVDFLLECMGRSMLDVCNDNGFDESELNNKLL